MRKSKILSLLLTFAMLASLVTVAPAMAAEETTGHWSDPAMNRWSSVGVFNGDQYGDFLPDKEMTRAEFAQVLVNLMGYTETAENTYADIPADAWYADAVLKLVAAGVLQGTGYNEVGATASPLDPITREQSAVLLCRALSLKPSADAKIDMPDADTVSDWAKDAVAALTERGMLSGMGDGNVAPAVVINRGSVAQMLSNMVAAYVTEDGAVVTGEQKGVVIVASKEVSFENATLTDAVVVAPKAAKASVTLTAGTTAADVVVAAEGATVVVGKNATVSSVTLDAARSNVEVSGKVDTVSVTASASSATVTAKDGAKVGTVTTAAANTTVDGAKNTISNIVVEAGSTGADVRATGAQLQNNSSETVGKVAPGATGSAPGSVSSSTGSGVVTGSVTSRGTYAITKDTVVGSGSFTVKVNGKTASSADDGDKVTVTATPSKGYKLESIEVTDKDGKAVFVTVADNVGTFTMPKSKVTVKVTFVEIPVYSISSDVGLVYSVGSDTNVYTLEQDVKVTFTVDGEEVTAAPEGAKVTVKVASVKGYAVSKIVIIVDGEETEAEDGVFTMPAENDVKVKVYFTTLPDDQSFDVTKLPDAQKDKDAITAEEMKSLGGFFTVTGNVAKRTSDSNSGGPVVSVEVAEDAASSIGFTLTAPATVKVEFSSTSGSNTSICGILKVVEGGEDTLVDEDSGQSTVTGASKGRTTFTYTGLAVGSYKVVSPKSSEDNLKRGCRVYSITVEF